MLGVSAGLSNVKSMKASSAWDVTKLNDLFAWFKYNSNITLGVGDQVSTWASEYGSSVFRIDGGKVLKNSGDLNFDTNNGRMALGTAWDPGPFAVQLVCKITAEEISNE